MVHMRVSRGEDVPRLRELWRLAFGDGEAYLDNFFLGYYTPGRVLVLEEEGEVQAMTAWFPRALVLPGGERWRAGYLYAVATHPQARSRGHASSLLSYCDFYLKEEQGCQAVTTVPAREELHAFFGRNGFRECFTLSRREREAGELPAPEAGCVLREVGASEYGRTREALLAGTAHIFCPGDSLRYQRGACRLSGGGLYVGETPWGPACLCAEGAGEGVMVCKELLGAPRARRGVESLLAGQFPHARRFQIREMGEEWAFGMLKWLYPGLAQRWDWGSTACPGLAFD